MFKFEIGDIARVRNTWEEGAVLARTEYHVPIFRTRYGICPRGTFIEGVEASLSWYDASDLDRTGKRAKIRKMRGLIVSWD